ncbi:MAG: phosphotransferase [Patescibacteria group bacterium]
MISPDDIKRVCEQYGLGTYTSIDVVAEGVLNENYIITTDSGRYFVKSVREKSRTKIPEIYGIESWMKLKGIPAIAMRTTLQGEICVAGDHELYTLYEYVESDRSHAYSLEDYLNMGAMLGKIHIVGKEHPPISLKIKEFGRPSPEIISDRLGNFRKLILDKTSPNETDGLMLEYIDFKLDVLQHIDSIFLPNDTITHGDYQTGNIMIDSASRKIIGICDWEKTEFAPRSYEVARAIFYICFQQSTDLNQNLRAMKEFLKGYRTMCSIGAEELMRGIHMRIAKMAMSAWVEDMYYNQHSDRANHFITSEIRIMELAIKGNLYKELEANF